MTAVTSTEKRDDTTNPFNMMSLHVTKVKGITFPTYVSPDVKDDMVCIHITIFLFLPNIMHTKDNFVSINHIISNFTNKCFLLN